ncbi:putative cobaltochelatase [Granulicoccus phenolivorans]|uniref:putative cobaltochelatase n=1 Tax=Granulicoccus phenolivorans TaxID=266854 RepID=UPI0004061509|nr:putative cobaltochelatase [Granulicoccus phenolivorans]
MTRFPFAAVVGADDMALALLLTTISPSVGGVLVRGEKGTAKSTMVRALAELLPAQQVVTGCRFGCDPAAPDPGCPDGPHPADAPATRRAAQLVELPVGATEDRVIGSLDLQSALGEGRASFEPGLLARAHRGLLYVDEVNLLHDHLVDLLLDAAAMGRNTVERDGVSVSHAARIVLVGTMNPEEGELRPQLLDRFGLTVEVSAPRDPAVRAEVVRRRMAFDADPEGFVAAYAPAQQDLATRIATARELLPQVTLSGAALIKIAEVCAGFEVDGMRADIMTARAALAHAAWSGRTAVTRADIRAAARLALPHRRRRNPFDAPGLDEDLLDRLLGDDDPEPDPEPEPEPDAPDPTEPDPTEPDPTGPTDGADGDRPDGAPDPAGPRPESPADRGPEPAEQPTSGDPEPGAGATVPVGIAPPGQAYRTKLFTARGIGSGQAGRRSRALTSRGRRIGATTHAEGPVHLPATILAAAPHQQRRGRQTQMLFRHSDLRRAITEGRESNLILFCVDASGSMAARRRMEAVKTATLSLLLDAYQRRDKVALVSFRGSTAELLLPPTGSVDAAARRLADLPHGGRTPLAEGLWQAAQVLRTERIRDPKRRPLLVLITDGRATSGPDALARADRVADLLREQHVDCLVIDCESGRLRLGLAGRLAHRLGADHVALESVGADQILSAVAAHRPAA